MPSHIRKYIHIGMDAKSIINFCSTFASACAFASNFLSFKYITTTYDIAKSPYYILALDSAFASALSGLGTFVCLFVTFQSGPISCSLRVLTTPTIAAIQPFLAFFISLIRMKRVLTNSPNGWKSESKLIRMANWLLLSLFSGMLLCPAKSIRWFWSI